MSKIANSYKSLSRGVSQQTPDRRLDGQHTEQVNLISDPVRGLCRRQGSLNINEAVVSTTAGVRSALEGYITRDIILGDRELVLLYSPDAVGTPANPIYAFDRATGASVPVSFTSVSSVRAVLANGVSAVTVAGRFVLLAGNNYTPTYTTVTNWERAQVRGVGWVKGGAYKRTYKLTVYLDIVGGGYSPFSVTATATTPSATYPYSLDTSYIAYDDPEYTQKVNTAVNNYNGAVTEWLATAAAASTPEAIAETLRANLQSQFSALGALGLNTFVTRTGSHIFITTLGVTRVGGVAMEDGGDGSLVTGCGPVVQDASDLTRLHFPGVVVKVAPPGETAYYVKSISKENPTTTNVTEVRWEEASETTVTPNSNLVACTMSSGTLYVGHTVAALAAALPGESLPVFTGRAAGDADSNPAPYWIDKPISYLGFFQDRLVVGSGPVLSFSKVGDYFNFFKDSALTTVDSDPAEGWAVGSDNDIIRRSVIFDKSLLLFGERQQYTVSGRVPVTPATLTIMQSSAHSDATLAAPITAGDLVFYAKSVEQGTQVFQIEIGNVDDTSKSSEVTQQLTDYIEGEPVQMLGLSLPDCIVVRASGRPNSVYLFRYIDQGQQRLLDSWSRWDFAASLGPIVGLSVHAGMLRLVFVRGSGSDAVVAFDECSVRGVSPSRPHLDSLRTMTSGLATSAWACAFGPSHPTAALQGTSDATAYTDLLTEFPGTAIGELWAGAPFSSYVTLTSPYVKDRDGNSITSGRTTVQSLLLNYNETSAFSVNVTTNQGTREVLSFNGRIVSALDTFVGVVPVSSGKVSAFIGRENSKYDAAIYSRTWLPFTLTGVEWTGQFFNNTRRG